MTSDASSGIPGWFIALFILFAILGVATFFWRISTARKIAERAGLDPDTATAVTLLSDGGMAATYVASTIASQAHKPARPTEPPKLSEPPKSVEQRLQELEALRDKGVITPEEYDTQRQKILGSI